MTIKRGQMGSALFWYDAKSDGTGFHLSRFVLIDRAELIEFDSLGYLFNVLTILL
jgi:hypothetical protein